jgi:hypothetical protein
MMRQTLPGMDYDGQNITELETVTRQFLDNLRAANILTDAHMVTEAAIMTCARSMSRSAVRGQSVALAAASKELREWVALLPTAPADADAFTQLMEELGATS